MGRNLSITQGASRFDRCDLDGSGDTGRRQNASEIGIDLAVRFAVQDSFSAFAPRQVPASPE